MVLPDVPGVTPKALDSYASQLSMVPDVPSVSAPDGTFVAGGRVGPPSAGAGVADGSAFLTVASSAPLYSRLPTRSWTGCTRFRVRAVSRC